MKNPELRSTGGGSTRFGDSLTNEICFQFSIASSSWTATNVASCCCVLKSLKRHRLANLLIHYGYRLALRHHPNAIFCLYSFDGPQQATRLCCLFLYSSVSVLLPS